MAKQGSEREADPTEKAMFIVYTIVHIVCTAQTRESELWSSGAETGLEPWPSTFLTPLRHSAGIHALHNKSPALRECIPFLGFNRTPQNRSPRKMLTRELLFNACTDVASPHRAAHLLPFPRLGLFSPHLPSRTGQSSRGQVQARQVPRAHTPPRGPI